MARSRPSSRRRPARRAASAGADATPARSRPAARSRTPAIPGGDEAALRASEARLRAILDSALDAVIGIDAESRVTYWNPTAEQMFGWSAAEARGRPLPELIMPERHRRAHREGVARFVRERRSAMLGRRMAFEGMRRDGGEFPLELRVSAIPDGDGWAFHAFCTDLSERRAAEAALRASEERFRALAENSSTGIAVIDAGGRMVYMSPSVERVLGHAPDELVDRHFDLIVHPDNRAAALASLEEVLAHPGVPFANQTRVQHRDGTWRWVELVTVNQLANPSVRGIVSSFRDITAAKSAERERRRTEERYRQLFETAPVGIYQTSPDGRVLTANAELARMLGFDTPEQMQDLDFRTVYRDPAQRDALVAIHQRHGTVADLELAWRRRDGSPIQIQLNARAIEDEHGGIRYYEGFVRDVTQRVRLEEQLRQAQKMEAVGRLAGGVAHDFNNLLTAILGYSDLAHAEAAGQESLQAKIAEIHRAGERATALTRQLLAFSRRQVLQPVALDLNVAVRDLLPMLTRLIGEDIQVVTELAPGLDRVEADPMQVQQVLLNLAVNARDAMPGGGRLEIATANVTLRSEQVASFPGASPGRHVELTVTDSGRGMDAQTLSQIFEPFFTTKELGKGTGLGLSTVYGIVRQSNGHIRVESEPGRGSRFSVCLPSAASAAAAPEEAARAEAPAGAEAATILVAEDEPAVRSLVRSLLSSEGYRVIEAGSAAEALAASRGHDGPIQLLLTDVVMPGGGVAEAASRMTSERPGLRVLYMSGYSDASDPDDPLGIPAHFIQKPFVREQLLSAVRGALAATA